MPIKIDLQTISKEGDSIFGNIYFDNEEIIFPEKQWNDFIVIVLNWWSNSLLNLINNKSISESFDFMDGPLSLKVNYTKENKFDIYFIHKDEVIDKTIANAKGFSEEFIKQVNLLLRVISKEKWDNEEIEKLKVNYNKLLFSYKDLINN